MTFYYYYKDTKGEWRWRLKGDNGRVLAESGEGYKHESDCLEDIRLVKHSQGATVVKQYRQLTQTLWALERARPESEKREAPL